MGMKKRLVITGMGVVSPIGNSVPLFWEGLLAGTVGVDRITRFDTSNIPVHIAAEIKEEDFTDRISARDLRTMDRFTQYACYASCEALSIAQLKIGQDLPSDQIGVVFGNGIGGIPYYEQALLKFDKQGISSVSPFTIPIMIANMASGRVSLLHNIQGPVSNVVTACASGTDALIQACHLLELGHCKAVITGGTEASITEFCIAGFAALKALSTRNDTPEIASSPFDKNRDGFVMGEGAGVLVLETLDCALERGAPIYAEVVGYGSFGDAHHITSPPEDGHGIVRAMRKAMDMAGVTPHSVEYINAHGTSTPINDRIETRAIKEVFQDHASSLKVSSIKGHIGHTVAGAGALEAVACALALKHGKLPPTVGLQDPDVAAGCDLDYIPHRGVVKSVEYALSNSLGFGGHNSSILFKKYS